MAETIERFVAPPRGEALVLSERAREAWERDGVLVLEGFASRAEVAALRARMDALLGELPKPEAVFSTVGNDHAREAWFRTSGGAIRAFAEEDDPGAVNKVGHALHDLDPTFAAFSRQPRLRALAAALGIASPRLVQSMYIFKSPEVGGEVTWHQDSTYLYTEPPSVVGFWVALADATVHNGCLRAQPGAHRSPLRRRFHYDAGGDLVHTELDPTPWPAPDDPTVVDLEVPCGSLVVLHGLLPHASQPNRSSDPRPAYALHVVDGAAHYASDNWLQRDDFRGF